MVYLHISTICSWVHKPLPLLLWLMKSLGISDLNWFDLKEIKWNRKPEPNEIKGVQSAARLTTRHWLSSLDSSQGEGSCTRVSKTWWDTELKLSSSCFDWSGIINSFYNSAYCSMPLCSHSELKIQMWVNEWRERKKHAGWDFFFHLPDWFLKPEA